MRSKAIFSLRVKLTLFTILLIASVGAVVMAVTSEKMQETLSSEIKEKGVAIAKSIARSSEDALVGKGDELYLFQFITSAMKNKGVTYVQIVDSSNVVRAHSDIKLSGTPYKEEAGLVMDESRRDYSVREGRTAKGEGYYDISVPITLAGNEDKTIGTVHLGLSMKTMKEAADRVRTLIAEIALGGLLLGGIGAFTLAKITVSPIRLLVKGVNEIGRGNLDQTIRVRRNDEIGELTTAFNDMARGLREKELIKDTFGRYMDKRLADQLINRPEGLMLELGGEHRFVSILFTDIRGFTAMSEVMDPKDVVSFLNEYFSMMVEIVSQHGGFIDKFIGDAMMVVFGVPVKVEDDALRCVRTALALRSAMREFNEKRTKSGKSAVHMGIGINSGIVVAGNLGSKSRMNYTIVGDAVNLAARLVALSKEEDVIISEQTYKLVNGNFKIEKKDAVPIKGKQELQQVYEVVGA